MIEVQCPRCESILEAPDTAAGKIIACPNCDADISVPVPASAQVIDVHAVGLDDDKHDPEPEIEDDPLFSPAHRQPGAGPMWGRTIRVTRTGDGSGCCLLGCAGVLFFLFLAIRGFFSLFE